MRMKGKKLSKETKHKISKAQLTLYAEGKRNPPNYIDGRSYDGYPLEFKRIRSSKIIFIRDKFQCQLCGEYIFKSKPKDKNKLSIHHIDYNKQNNHLNNLISLCTFCNISVNKNREEWIKYFHEKMIEVKNTCQK